MKDGTVLLVPYDPNEKNPIYKLVGWVIKKITKEDFTHTAIFFNGKYYDDTLIFKGLNIKSGVRSLDAPDYPVGKTLEYVGELTPEQFVRMQSYLIFYANEPIHYSILKLVTLSFVYPTKWFWDLIGWVPFSKFLFGEVCSTFVAEAWKFAGVDLFKGIEQDELVSPGDFLRSTLLKEI